MNTQFTFIYLSTFFHPSCPDYFHFKTQTPWCLIKQMNLSFMPRNWFLSLFFIEIPYIKGEMSQLDSIELSYLYFYFLFFEHVKLIVHKIEFLRVLNMLCVFVYFREKALHNFMYNSNVGIDPNYLLKLSLILCWRHILLENMLLF